MKKLSRIDDYLRKYSVGEKWKLIANDTDNISQVIVIPAYAERESIFHTLASIAQNASSSLEYSFILCVINNKANSPVTAIENNKKTIECLDALLRKKSFSKSKADDASCSILSDANLKLGFINASSPGLELPQNAGGVGMARKIGMDMALRLLQQGSASQKLIISLDADTLVQNNYLSTIHGDFRRNIKTAIVAYAHQMPSDLQEKAAICCYEIFLRYWVLALRYAQSPWAFHSIGSTIVTSTESYLDVRGMNKREAGEDFYFLSKLAKIGGIHYINKTCVYPSARPSVRVPFGTGKRIQRFLSGEKHHEYLLYDPRIFSVLADWLKLMRMEYFLSTDEILKKAAQIHPMLKEFLNHCEFAAVWSRIRRHTKDEKTMKRQFNDWFDGFKTLKLVNFFTKEVHPQMNMFEALEKMFSLSNLPWLKLNSDAEIPSLEEQMKILEYLQKIT